MLFDFIFLDARTRELSKLNSILDKLNDDKITPYDADTMVESIKWKHNLREVETTKWLISLAKKTYEHRNSRRQ